MKFPSAAKGVKKLYTAELLTILSTLALFVCVIMILIQAPSLSAGAGSDIGAAVASLGFGLIFCVLAFFVFAVVAWILRLIGVINASRDEANFKSALILMIISVILSGVAGALVSHHIAFNMLYTFSNLFSFFSVLFIVSGFVKLADRLNRGDISAKGSSVVKLLLLLEIISFILGIVSSFTGNIERSVLTGILLLAVMVLGVAQSVLCLGFLSRAKAMLLKG